MSATATAATSWLRPRTDTAAWARVIEIAKRLDLVVEVANTQGAADRHGRFWVIDRSLKQRAGRAETLEGVLEILVQYEQHRPTGKPQVQPWPARIMRWRPWPGAALRDGKP